MPRLNSIGSGENRTIRRKEIQETANSSPEKRKETEEIGSAPVVGKGLCNAPRSKTNIAPR